MEFHPGECEMLRITNLTNPSQIKADYKIHSTTFATKKDEQQSNIILKQNRHWPSYVEISLLPPENKKRVLQNLCKTSTRVWRLCLGPRTPIRKIIYLTWRKFRKKQSPAPFVTGNHGRSHGSTVRNLAILE